MRARVHMRLRVCVFVLRVSCLRTASSCERANTLLFSRGIRFRTGDSAERTGHFRGCVSSAFPGEPYAKLLLDRNRVTIRAPMISEVSSY